MKNTHPKKYAIASALVSGIIFSLSASSAIASDITPENILYNINKERIYHGLMPFTVDANLNQAASAKSGDMIDRDYFEHYAFGLSPWDFIHNSGYDYLYAGENLAMNFSTSEGVVKAWMDSPSHRRNLMDEDFDEVGIGVVKGTYSKEGNSKETTMVTNLFGRKKPFIVNIFNEIVDSVSNIFSK